jgi:LmbE family N-acetylglucosaminyl deacetylase
MMSENVAVIAAHPDDEVLGCGGTIARMVLEGFQIHVLLLADGESSRDVESGESQPGKIAERESSAVQACNVLGCTSVQSLALPDNRMDGVDLLDVVKHIETFIHQYQPGKVFTHHMGDVNIDHRVVHDAVLAACRPQPNHPTKELLFFEVPSSTEWRPPGSGVEFHPNYFVDISATIHLKLQALKVYKEELREFPHPRSIRAVEALAQWRGASVGVEAAEAFILGRKLI